MSEISKIANRPVAVEPQQEREPQVDMVAKLYEKQFLREMVKAMRSTVSFSDVTKPSMAEDIFKTQLDEQYVEMWGDRGGIGLGDMIYESLMGRLTPTQLNLIRRQSAPKVPPAAEGAREKKPDVPGVTQMRIDMGPGRGRSLLAPWAGTVLSKFGLDGVNSYSIDHGGGLTSDIIYRGTALSDLRPGSNLTQGQELGFLDPVAKSYFWHLKNSSV